MKKFKSLLLIGGVIFFLPSLQAEKVTIEKAQNVAKSYAKSSSKLNSRKDFKLTRIVKKSLQKQGLRASGAQEEAMYYVFGMDDNRGFIIVSADDVATPVLGYSENGMYGEDNPNFNYWMDFLSQEIAYAIENNLPQDETIKAQWDSYINGNASVLRATTAVGPLIETTWTQCYNDSCPIGTNCNGRVPAGCTAIAMAQIINYHEHPKLRTVPIPGYKTLIKGISIPAITWTSDYWDGSSAGSLALIYHCGVAVQMEYFDDWSMSINLPAIQSAFPTYFDYSSKIQFEMRSDYDKTSDWENVLKTEIDAERPVLYGGFGTAAHTFICDGYDDGNPRKFHFNWGNDNGLADGFFVTSVLNPKYSNGKKSDYSNAQQILINIRPRTNDTPPKVSEVLPVGTNVPLKGDICIWFDKAMTTLANVGTVSLRGGAGTVNNSAKTWTKVFNTSLCCIIPYSGLTSDTQYTLVISGFKDSGGIIMDGENSDYTFTTISLPKISAVSPANGAKDVHVSGKLILTFDREMTTTDGVGTVSLGGGTGTVNNSTKTWSSDNTVCTISYSGLAYNTNYTYSISGFKDVEGKTMTAVSSGYTFTTALPSPPQLFYLSPANGEKDVDVNGIILVYFDRAMTTTTGVGTVSLGGGTVNNSTKKWLSNTICMIEYSGLAYNKSYTYNVSGFKDIFGYTMTEISSGYTFTTVSQLPKLSTISPTGGATDVPVSGKLILTFDREMMTTAGVGTVSLGGGTVNNSTKTWSTDNKTCTISYSGLAYNTNYTYNISGFMDAGGNTMTEISSGYTFTTASLSLLPRVSEISPANGASNVPVEGELVITFDKAMTTTVGVGTVTLGGGIVNNSTKTWSSGNTVCTISYSGLAYNTNYTYNISGFKDADGNTMNAISSGYTFTTVSLSPWPKLIAVSPINREKYAPVSGNFILTFDKAMDTTADVGTVSLSGGAGTINNSTKTWTLNNTICLISYSGLPHGTRCTCIISGFMDTSGNTMNEVVYDFFTTTFPVRAASPADGATGVPTEGELTITFDKMMDTTPGTGLVTLEKVMNPSLVRSSAMLSGETVDNENRTWTSGSIICKIPYFGLAHNTSYTYNISGFREVISGNVIEAITSGYSFTTIAAPVSIEKAATDRLSVYNRENTIYAVSNPSDLIKTIAVYTMQGVLIYNDTNVNASSYSFTLKNPLPEVVLVKVTTNNGIQNVKLIKK